MVWQGFLIRKATPADLEPIIQMCKSSMLATYGSFLAEEKIKPWIEGNETDKYVGSMLGDMLVAMHEEGIVGVVSIASNTIDLVWVAPAKRGHGIGTALLTAAEDLIWKSSYSTARLEVFEPNSDAIRFYETHGWKRQEVYPDPVAGVDKVLMEKTVTRSDRR